MEPVVNIAILTHSLWYKSGKAFLEMFLKHRRFLYLPINNKGNFIVPRALAR